MKQYLLRLLFAFSVASLSAQTSSVFLQNNTRLNFGISAVQSGTHIMSPGEWTQLASDMYPWEMQKEILNTNRDAGVHNGETFYFDIAVWHGTDTFVMQLKLNGTLFGSEMDYSLKGLGFNHAWFDDGGFHQQSLTFGGLPVTIKYRPDGTDAFFTRNIVFAIHHDTVPYMIDSVDLSNPNVINVLSYNVQFLPFGVSGLPYAAERGAFIPTELSPNQDVVIVQEAFDDNARNNYLIPSMVAAGFTHRTDILNDDQAPIWNGGVMIFSRWPIEFEDEYDYLNCDNNAADCLAAKGILYARVNKLGKKYHIFGTHVEAGGNANDIAIKKQQFGEQRDFIAAQNIPANEAVILGGDMNTDAVSIQYPDLVDSLNPIIGLHKGFYASTAVDRDSGNIIDHVWGHREHLVPVDCYTKVWIYRTIEDNMFGIFDPSDHLPTNGRFEYPDADSPAVMIVDICDTITPMQLQLTAAGHPLQSYQWYFNGNPIAGATTPAYFDPVLTLSDTGVYACMMTTRFTVEDTTVLGHPNWPDTAIQVLFYEMAQVIFRTVDMNPIITQSNDTLFSSAASGNQWYDANGPIPGATDAFYVMPLQGGNYYVIVSEGTCSSNSSNQITWVSTHTIDNQNYFKLYPNPAQEHLTIEASDSEYSIEIMDATGRVLFRKIVGQKLTELSLQGFSAGMYWVKLVNEKGAFVKQLVVL